MGDYYFAFDLQKLKSMYALRVESEHDMRTDLSTIPNVDPNRAYLNRALVDGTYYGQDYVELWHKREFECNANGGEIKIRKNTVYAVKIYVGFTHGADDTFSLEDWIEANKKWFEESFGKENVIALTLHMDESTPHIHAVITPIDERGRLNIKPFTNIRKLRYTYGKAMEPFGLKEGEKYTKADANAIKKFYREVNICEQTKAPKREPDEPEDIWENRVNVFVENLMYKQLQERAKLARKLKHENAKHIQTYVEYKEAIKLFDMLFDKFNGDKEMVKEQLRRYQNMEQNIPMKTYDDLLTHIEARYVQNDNLKTADLSNPAR